MQRKVCRLIQPPKHVSHEPPGNLDYNSNIKSPIFDTLLLVLYLKFRYPLEDIFVVLSTKNISVYIYISSLIFSRALQEQSVCVYLINN